MGQFIFNQTGIEEVFVIGPKVFGDERGYFMETYNKTDFEKAGIACEFVQDNQSRSKQGGIPWDNSTVNIAWPEFDGKVCLSEKDKVYIELAIIQFEIGEK